MKVQSIAIGLNYTGTPNQLGGCENDARFWQTVFQKKWPGDKSSHVRSTKCGHAEIIQELVDAQSLSASDLFILQFSGHGTQVPQSDGTYKEAIVLHDGQNWSYLYDYELRAMLSKIKALSLVILDSCFSGGMDRAFLPDGVTRRFVPYNSDMQAGRMAISPTMRLSIATPKIIQSSQLYMMACDKTETAADLGDMGAFSKGCQTAINAKQRTTKQITMKAYDVCGRYQSPQYVTAGKRKTLTII